MEIIILRQHWIEDDGKDDPLDLCSHGEVYLRIGEEVLSNKLSGSWALTSTGLYLMRSINEDYTPNSYASKLLPCCGHSFMTSAGSDLVEIMGCGLGIDWTIKHLNDNLIKHVSENGSESIINKQRYRKMVSDFVNKVEEFYMSGESKILPEDDFTRKGYEAFLKEWSKLKSEL